MNLNDGSAENLGNLDPPGINPGVNVPYGIALDTNAGKMYVTGYFNNAVFRANLDGSDPENLGNLDASGDPLERPWGIALDLSAGKMYVTSTNKNAVLPGQPGRQRR